MEGNCHAQRILKWMRYVDDIFLLWMGTEKELDLFLTYLNTRHNLIEFTVTKSQTTVQYLDVEITKVGSELSTKLFSKATDRNNTLERNSFHAPQTFGGILNSQFIRAKRICITDDDYRESAKKIVRKIGI